MTGLLLALVAAVLPVLLIQGARMYRDPGDVANAGGPLLSEDSEGRGDAARGLEAKLAATAGRRLAAALDPSARAWIDRRLDVTGRPQGETVESLVATQIVWLGLGVVLGLVVLAIVGSVVVAVGIILVFAAFPALLVINRGKKRQGRIERELPEFLDVLSVVMQAGLSYRAGLHRVTSELTGPVSQELRQALAEMELGSTRRDAFARIQQRTSAPGLRRFIVAQSQAEELGVPLAEAVSTLAAEMRRRYDQALRRWATKQRSLMDLVNVSFMMFGCLLAIVVMLLYAGGLLGEGGVFSQSGFSLGDGGG